MKNLSVAAVASGVCIHRRTDIYRLLHLNSVHNLRQVLIIGGGECVCHMYQIYLGVSYKIY